MTRGVCWYLVGSVVLVALIALAGCSHFMWAEREPWRRDAELACLNSGAVKESPARVRISSIDGPGACGIDYPLRVSSLGESAPLSYDDEVLRPPGAIPQTAMPQPWPGATSAPSPIQSRALPPMQSAPMQSAPLPPPVAASSQGPYAAAPGAPLQLYPQSNDELDDEDALGIPGGPPHPYYGGPQGAPYPAPANPMNGNASPPPLGPPRMPVAPVGPVAVTPAATLACPIVSALDQWIGEAVQPAAMRWFRQPVVAIKQISAYSCRGMNGNPDAHISEHSFGNALDIAEFELADGHKISVQYGWQGTPEEQGFLHDVQSAACEQFTTVLAPGANVYHYNHIHVDLMRHASGRHICEPTAIPGEVAAARARGRYAGQHYGAPGITGSISAAPYHRALGYSGEDDDRSPAAVPGND